MSALGMGAAVLLGADLSQAALATSLALGAFASFLKGATD
jgi:hypothetical protein